MPLTDKQYHLVKTQAQELKARLETLKAEKQALKEKISAIDSQIDDLKDQFAIYSNALRPQIEAYEVDKAVSSKVDLTPAK
jgi:predicted nuclease with TOPRIM domain